MMLQTSDNRVRKKPPKRKAEMIADKGQVSQRLLTDDSFVLEALEILLDAQTWDERTEEATKWANGRGFDRSDAKRLTTIAQDAIERGYLSVEELAICRKLDKRGHCLLAKYWRQLPEASPQDRFNIERFPTTEDAPRTSKRAA